MKNVFKQSGKAICYLLLFTGSQFLISFIMQVIYGVKVGMAAASSGTTPSNQEIIEGTNEFLMNNMNWLALISGLLTLFILWLVFIIRRKKIFQEAGFTLKELIIKEQHNCRATGYWKTNSVKYNFLLIAHEYLFIFRK